MKEFGGPHLRSYCAASTAALVRTAIKTVSGWEAWIPQLKVAAERFLPLRPLVKEMLTTDVWDNPPISLHLANAAKGLPEHRHWGTALLDQVNWNNSTEHKNT